jgi:Methyl-accepting chemotaxis protein (MCP) signalling domain
VVVAPADDVVVGNPAGAADTTRRDATSGPSRRVPLDPRSPVLTVGTHELVGISEMAHRCRLSGRTRPPALAVIALPAIAEHGGDHLLALNAAIEAARAGEQGRGFAVVAEEVRKPAEESSQAAASIAALIGEIQDETKRAVEVVELGGRRTDEGAGIVEQAREAFDVIDEHVQEMSGRVSQIAASAQTLAATAADLRALVGQCSLTAAG